MWRGLFFSSSEGCVGRYWGTDSLLQWSEVQRQWPDGPRPVCELLSASLVSPLRCGRGQPSLLLVHLLCAQIVCIASWLTKRQFIFIFSTATASSSGYGSPRSSWQVSMSSCIRIVLCALSYCALQLLTGELLLIFLLTAHITIWDVVPMTWYQHSRKVTLSKPGKYRYSPSPRCCSQPLFWYFALILTTHTFCLISMSSSRCKSFFLLPQNLVSL